MDINLITVFATIAIIIFILICFVRHAYKIKKCYKILDKACKSGDILENLSKTKLAEIKNTYLSSINISTENGLKTNMPANIFFSEQTTSKVFRWNIRMLDAASGTLVGLGLMGTFLGLTLGIYGFDDSNAENIQNSIKSLLGGMSTAFLTSLVGMGASLIFILFFEKPWKNKLSRSLFFLTEKLDEQYYIDDLTLININQKSIIQDLRDNIIEKLDKQLSYINNDGQKIEVANAVREILKENEEQSKALKSFSTDLAIELNNGFDEVLSRQMQERLLPLMENIDQTTKTVVEHIDLMAANVSSPATEMIQNVVEELKRSMTSIMNEFKNNLSGDATNHLEELAESLATVTRSMADFPQNMENISMVLQVSINEVKNAISEISNTSMSSNSTAMQLMQEQITFATTSISNAIIEVKEVMSTITQSSEQSSQEMIMKLSSASQQMGEFLNNTLSQLSLSVKDSVQEITDDVANKQNSLLMMHEDTIGKTEKLLNTFNHGLERMEHMNEYITGSMDMFQKAQGEITGSTANLRSITGNMKTATEVFSNSQNSYSDSIKNILIMNQKSIDSILELIKNSSEMSEDYVQNFETIKNGLTLIFGQVQTGLSEYSRTVQASTQKYLDEYSTNLTRTTDALQITIQLQNEVVEMLTETISKNKN